MEEKKDLRASRAVGPSLFLTVSKTLFHEEEAEAILIASRKSDSKELGILNQPKGGSLRRFEKDEA